MDVLWDVLRTRFLAREEPQYEARMDVLWDVPARVVGKILINVNSMV